jgi:hypothetical protein
MHRPAPCPIEPVRAASTPRRGRAPGPGARHWPGHPGPSPGRPRGVGQGPGDDPVDVIQPGLQDPDADADRKGDEPDPENLSHDACGELLRHGERDESNRGAAGEPLQLLASLPRRSPPAEHLVGHERQPDDHDRGKDGSSPCGRMIRALHITEGVEADVMTGHRGDRLGEDEGHHAGYEPRISPQHPPPAPRRQPAVREQQDDQGEQGDRGHPQRLQHDSDRSERQPVVAQVVGEHRVVTGVDADRDQQDENEQDPADGVARLVARDNDTNRGVDQDGGDRWPDVEDRQLVDEAGQRYVNGRQEDHQGAEDRRGRRRRQGQAAGRDFRRYRCLPARWPHLSHETQR